MALYIGNKKYCSVIKTGVRNKDILITENGSYAVEEGYSGFGVVRVHLPEPIYDVCNVTPTTSAQTITPLNDGFSQVNVAAVTSAIDSDIVAGNIKKGINILGVTGTLEFTTETLTVTPTTSKQTKTPTANGYSSVTVNAVTSAIDSNIVAGNIKKGTKILGVTGTLVESVETTRNITSNGVFTPGTGYTGFSSVTVDVKVEHEELNITPSTSEQTFTAIDDYHGYSPVVVAPVTADIDSNIVAGNIKNGVSILGVTGTCVELVGETQTKSITSTAGNTFTPSTGKNGITSIKVTPTNKALTVSPSTSDQTINVPTGYSGHGTVTVNKVTSAIDSNIAAANILSGVTILGVTGTAIQSKTQTKTITSNGTFTPDTGYNGFSSVTVNVNTVNNTTLSATPTTAKQTHTPAAPYTGYSSVEIAAVTSAIDSNIAAGNIKSGVTILGVAGTVTQLNGETRTVSLTKTGATTFIPSSGKNAITSIAVSPTNQNITITPTTSQQTKTVPTNYSGYGTITVNAVTSSIDSNIKASNIAKGVTILGVTGTMEASSPLTTKTITVDANTATTSTYTAPSGYDGFSSVTLDLTWVENQLKALNAGDSTYPLNLQKKTVTLPGTYTADSGYDGLESVTVDLSGMEAQIEYLKGQAINSEVDDFLSGSGTAFASDVTTVREFACFYQTNLAKAILNNATTIKEGAFSHTGLTTLAVRANSVCTLSSIDALDSTPIANGTGFIYVPDSLVDTYKAAPNWVVYASQIKALSTMPA